MSDTHFAGADRAAGYGVEEHESITPPPLAPVIAEEPAAPAAVIESVPEALEPAPEAVPAVTATPGELLAGLTRASLRSSTPPVAKTGWRGFWARVGFKPEPSAAEKAVLEAAASLARDEEIIRQATYTRPIGVLVANPKGSASKTTVSLALGGTLAFCRGGGLAIVEVAEDPGTLTLRAEGNPRRGIGHLVAEHDAVNSAGRLDGYTAPQTSYARVIGSTGPREALTAEAVADVVKVVDEYFSMRVMDSGNQYTSPVFRAAVEAADVLVIPTLNAADTATKALELLDSLRAQGGHAAQLARTAVVLVLTDGRVEIPAVTEGVTQALAQAQVGQILSIPFDAHLAQRGEITLSQLHPDTYRAFVAAGAAVIRALEGVTN